MHGLSQFPSNLCAGSRCSGALIGRCGYWAFGRFGASKTLKAWASGRLGVPKALKGNFWAFGRFGALKTLKGSFWAFGRFGALKTLKGSFWAFGRFGSPRNAQGKFLQEKRKHLGQSAVEVRCALTEASLTPLLMKHLQRVDNL